MAPRVPLAKSKITAQIYQSTWRFNANQQQQQPRLLMALVSCRLFLLLLLLLHLNCLATTASSPSGKSYSTTPEPTQKHAASSRVIIAPSGNMSTQVEAQRQRAPQTSKVVGSPGQWPSTGDIEMMAPHRLGSQRLDGSGGDAGDDEDDAQHWHQEPTSEIRGQPQRLDEERNARNNEGIVPGSTSWMINGAAGAQQPPQPPRSQYAGPASSGHWPVAETSELVLVMDAIDSADTKRSQQKHIWPASGSLKLANSVAATRRVNNNTSTPKVIRAVAPPTKQGQHRLIDNEMAIGSSGQLVLRRRRDDGEPASALLVDSSIEPESSDGEKTGAAGSADEMLELEAANQAALTTQLPMETNKLKCRLEKDLYLDFDEYRLYTCANCYHQVPPEYFKNKLALRRLGERELRLQDRETDEFVWSNESDRIRDTFKDEEKYEKWRICCREAEVCCYMNSNYLSQVRNSQGQLIDDPRQTGECPGTWDGLSCWPPSAAGQIAWRICPRVAYLLDFEPACRGYVTKQCFSNASWYINRNGHEWSDYSTCSPEGLYKARMLHAALAYVCEALIVTPALFIFGKFSNRGGNKRIRIMKSLLLYILMNAIIQGLQRGFLSAGFFAEYRAGPTRPEHHAHSHKSARLTHQTSASAALLNSTHNHQDPVTAMTPSAASLLLTASSTSRLVSRSSTGATSNESAEAKDEDDDEKALIGHIFERALETKDGNGTVSNSSLLVPPVESHLSSVVWPVASDKIGPNVMQRPEDLSDDDGASNGQMSAMSSRQKRNSTAVSAHVAIRPQASNNKRGDSAWKAIFCWLLQMASRLVRLMGYAWMFTGGVYLCSALHFAPAEPPAKFIKILFFLTNAFPNLIFFAYVTARTLNEPSPLNIILKVPYFWLSGDEEQVEHLLATQKVCWFEESKSERIEEIADLPNLILVGSNVVLFVITLVILCRINRPGSTRPDTSPCAYFKAAGTLLFLYGGHYFFLAYRPESESCSVDTFMFYAFICIDVVQGIAISIVFCYMTQEGKTVIAKYWRTRQRFLLVRQFTWLGCLKDKDKFAENGYHHSSFAMQQHNRFNQSTRSDNSACNGHNDNVTELININDTQISGQF